MDLKGKANTRKKSNKLKSASEAARPWMKVSKSLLEASLSKRKLVIPVGFQFKVLFGEVGCHLLFSEGHKITERATQAHFRLSDEVQFFLFFLISRLVSISNSNGLWR